jgi:hypothetical protein
MSGNSPVSAEAADAGEADAPAVSADTERSVSAPVTQEENTRSLSYEEFDPKGTLALIVTYLAILGVMWVFMYFVEFLGNDLVVIG